METIKSRVKALLQLLIKECGLFTEASSDDIEWAIHHPHDAMHLFIDALANRGRIKVPKMKLVAWKTVHLKKGLSSNLIKRLEEAGIVLDFRARSVLEETQNLVEDQIDLVVLTPADFGFTSPPKVGRFLTKAFLERWSKEHLDGQVVGLCQASVAVELRLEFKDQPRDTHLWIAMNRVKGAMLHLQRHRGGKGLWIHGHSTLDNNVLPICRKLVFTLKKV